MALGPPAPRARGFRPDERGFVGASQALLIAFGLAILILAGHLLSAGSRRAATDARRTLTEQGGSAGDIRGAVPPMGAAPIARPGVVAAVGERRELTPEQAAEAFRQLAALTFVTDPRTGATAPVPFHYPVDGCYARAHLMARWLEAHGIASDRVFAIATGSHELQVGTDHAGDVPPGQAPTVTWWYHTAPVVRVRGEDGLVREMVMDPSMADRPIPVDEWTRRMNGGRFTRLTVPEVRAQLNANGGDYDRGRDQLIVFVANRYTFFPTGEMNPPDWRGADAAMESVRGRLGDYAQRAQVHELAAALRPQLRGTAPDVDAMLRSIRDAPPLARRNLWALFPNLRRELAGKVSAADLRRIEDELNR